MITQAVTQKMIDGSPFTYQLSTGWYNQLWIFHHRLYRDCYVNAFQLTAAKYK